MPVKAAQALTKRVLKNYKDRGEALGQGPPKFQRQLFQVFVGSPIHCSTKMDSKLVKKLSYVLAPALPNFQADPTLSRVTAAHWCEGRTKGACRLATAALLLLAA